MTEDELQVFLDEAAEQELSIYIEAMEASIEDYFADSIEDFLKETK